MSAVGNNINPVCVSSCTPPAANDRPEQQDSWTDKLQHNRKRKVDEMFEKSRQARLIVIK